MNIVDSISLLDSYNKFEECLLLDYWSENLCRDFVVLVSNIWRRPGEMRTNLDEHDPVYLRFKQCQRVSVQNNFSDYVVHNSDQVNWGINEFSVVTVEEVEAELLRFRILWEQDRNIEIDCYSLQVEEGAATFEFNKKYCWQRK